MATTSLAWPAMFDISRNRIGVLEDNEAVINRTKLLILTEPTELYNSPNFGVGLKRHLWQYNSKNEQAIIRDRITEQLRIHEPYCDADRTQFADGLLFTGSGDESFEQDFQTLKMTIGVTTVFSSEVASVELNDGAKG